MREITYHELKQHATYSSAWISLNGIVYDITNFIDHHPFGDTFRGSLGTECAGLFSSSHLNVSVEKLIGNETYLKKNKIKIIGHLHGFKEHMRKNNADPFWIG